MIMFIDYNGIKVLHFTPNASERGLYTGRHANKYFFVVQYKFVGLPGCV